MFHIECETLMVVLMEKLPSDDSISLRKSHVSVIVVSCEMKRKRERERASEKICPRNTSIERRKIAILIAIKTSIVRFRFRFWPGATKIVVDVGLCCENVSVCDW